VGGQLTRCSILPLKNKKGRRERQAERATWGVVGRAEWEEGSLRVRYVGLGRDSKGLNRNGGDEFTVIRR